MLSLFIHFEIEKIAKYFRTKTTAKIITLLLFLMVFIFIALGVYGFFVSGFRFIQVESEEEIRLALTLFLYEVFLIVLSFIIIFSTIISSIFSLFRGSNNAWLMSSPAYRVLPKVIFIRTISNSLIPLFVIFLPAILAFNTVYHIGSFSVFIILVSFLIGVIFLNASTLSIVLIFSYLYYVLSKKSKWISFSFKGLFILVALMIASVIFFVWKNLHNLDLVTLFRSDDLTHTVSVVTISEYFYLLPTHTFAMFILNFQLGDTVSLLSNLFSIVFVSVISVSVWFFISRLFYAPWQKLQEGSNSITVRNTSSVKRFGYSFRGNIISVLYKKEFLVLTRNLKGVMWFLFLLAIWFMQIAANHILGYNIQKHEVDISQKSILLQTLQYVIAIYFISSFTLRFVFPSFSTERKTMWILASSPIDFKKVFFGKYLFFVSFFVVVGIVMNYLNSIVLHVSSIQTLYSMILFVSVVIFIVTLGLVFGALFPNTETDDPETISTSMSGLFFTAFALTYGAITDYALYISLSKGYAYPLWIAISITYILTYGMIYMIYRTKEFTFKK